MTKRNCKHTGARIRGRTTDGVDHVVCNDCGAILEETDPRMRAAVDRLYAKSAAALGAAHAIGSLEIAKLGAHGGRR